VTTEQNTEQAQPDLSTAEGRADHSVKLALNNPQNIPAKFRKEDGTFDVDAMTQSYIALEQKMSGGGSPDPTPDTSSGSGGEQSSDGQDPLSSLADAQSQSVTSEESSGSESGSIEDALSDPKPQPFDWQAAMHEVSTTGKVSDQTMANAKKAGIPEEAIKFAAAGYKAQQSSHFDKAAEIVGGKDALNATLQWARENKSSEERKALIEGIKGPNGVMILRGLHAEATTAMRPEGASLVDTGKSGSALAPSSNQVKPFRDQAELMAAIQDPRYKSDPDWRRQQEMRAAVTAGMDAKRFTGR
jgi:hypothetical protein